MNRLPPLAIALGAAGLIPFALFGFLSVLPGPGTRHFLLLIAYGAVILSFLGGVHEGFAVLSSVPLPGATKPPGDPGHAERMRLLGASACAAIAWVALAFAVVLPPWTALLTLIAAFIALPVAEQRAVAPGWMPRGYMRLRWVLSTIVVLILAAVLAARVVGVAG